MGPFIILITFIVVTVAFMSWSNSIEARQLEYSSLKDTYSISDQYIPLTKNKIKKNSENIQILKYKLQNAEYREQMMLLGLWHFGLSHIWKMNHNTIDPHKLAEVINDQMPWVVANSTYATLKTPTINAADFNYDIAPEGSPRFTSNPGDNSVYINNLMLHQSNYTSVNDSHNDQPDSFIDNDRNDTFSKYDPSIDSPDHYHEDIPLDTNDRFDYQSTEVNVQPDQNFFPFQ